MLELQMLYCKGRSDREKQMQNTASKHLAETRQTHSLKMCSNYVDEKCIQAALYLYPSIYSSLTHGQMCPWKRTCKTRRRQMWKHAAYSHSQETFQQKTHELHNVQQVNCHILGTFGHIFCHFSKSKHTRLIFHMSLKTHAHVAN